MGSSKGRYLVDLNDPTKEADKVKNWESNENQVVLPFDFTDEEATVQRANGLSLDCRAWIKAVTGDLVSWTPNLPPRAAPDKDRRCCFNPNSRRREMWTEMTNSRKHKGQWYISGICNKRQESLKSTPGHTSLWYQWL